MSDGFLLWILGMASRLQIVRGLLVFASEVAAFSPLAIIRISDRRFVLWVESAELIFFILDILTRMNLVMCVTTRTRKTFRGPTITRETMATIRRSIQSHQSTSCC